MIDLEKEWSDLQNLYSDNLGTEVLVTVYITPAQEGDLRNTHIIPIHSGDTLEAHINDLREYHDTEEYQEKVEKERSAQRLETTMKRMREMMEQKKVSLQISEAAIWDAIARAEALQALIDGFETTDTPWLKERIGEVKYAQIQEQLKERSQAGKNADQLVDFLKSLTKGGFVDAFMKVTEEKEEEPEGAKV